MTDLRTAAQQALEALEVATTPLAKDRQEVLRAQDALRAALAQQDQPQGCATEEECTYQPWCRIRGTCQRKQADPDISRCPRCGSAADNGHDRELPPNPYFCSRCMAQQTETVEPVAWRWGYRSVTTGEMDWRGYVEIAAHPNLRSPEIIIEPLYTAPPQRKQAEPAQEPITRLFGTLPVHDTQQALAQQAEPDHETRAELAEQQVVQLAEERDHYRNLWQKAQQAEPVQEPEGMVEFLADLQRSRTKYPKNRRMFDGLMGEIDELRRAYAGDGDIRAEAFDVAVCAFRIATEGDAGGNARLEPVEPFGYWFSDKHQDAVCSGWFVRSPCDGKLDGKPGVPLYTAPPRCPNCGSLEAQNTELDNMLVAMEHAVAQAAAVERKACADICDAHASCEGIAQQCAAAIRARGQA